MSTYQYGPSYFEDRGACAEFSLSFLVTAFVLVTTFIVADYVTSTNVVTAVYHNLITSEQTKISIAQN